MELFDILLLGHLIADFPLQTPMILNWKFRGGVWILPHIIIHLGVLILLVRNPLVVGVIIGSHFIIDWVKVGIDKGQGRGLSFLLDQVAHILVLWFVSLYVGGEVPQIAVHNLPFILILALISAVFMFLNVVKPQLAGLQIPKTVCNSAFFVSRISGWSAVFSLLLSVQILR